MLNENELPVQEELINRVGWFILLRWFAGFGVISTVLFSKHILGLILHYKILIFIAFIILLYNVVFSILLYRVKKIPGMVQANIQIVVDWIALTLLLYFSGGIENPFIFYFIFHMIIASILLPKKFAYMQATCAIVFISLIVMAEYFRIIPYFGIGGFLSETLYLDRNFVCSMLFVFATTSYISVYLAATITSKLRKRENELLQTFEKINALYEVAKLTSSTLDLNEVLDLVVKNAARLMNVKAASIRLLDEKGLQLNISAAFGLSDSYLKKGTVAVDKSLLDKEALSGDTVVIKDATTDPRFQYPEQARKEGICSVLCMPLVVKEKSIGVIRLYTSSIYDFSEKEISFLKALASQSAIAIENAKTYNELEEINYSRTEFFMTTAHELKTPLAAIQSCLKVVIEGYGTKIDDKSLNMIIRAENRASNGIKLVKDLLDLVNVKRTGFVSKGKKLDANEIVRKNIDMLSPMALEKNIKLEFIQSGNGLNVEIDENDFDLILSNLLINAINYSYSGGVVEINAKKKGENVLFVVSDAGIGIPDNENSKIFTEFFRAKNAKTKIESGTGLGLSIVAKIVKCYNGAVWVDSKVGMGSKFYFTLPAA